MITLTSHSDQPLVTIFRVEPSRTRRGGWAVLQAGSVVGEFSTRDAASEAAHTLAANAWRLRELVSRVVVVGEDGRPTSFRMYGDPSRASAPLAADPHQYAGLAQAS
jgi:hypothetical protein